MSIQEIDLKVKELRELQAMVEEATAQIEAIKDSIKMKMMDEGNPEQLPPYLHPQKLDRKAAQTTA